MNGTLAGVIDRTARGFDVTGVYSGDLKAIDHQRLVVVVRVNHEGGASDDARVLIDFSHARAPSCPGNYKAKKINYASSENECLLFMNE